jgi:alpha-tubulin suppressor-like RCC1 family protein
MAGLGEVTPGSSIQFELAANEFASGSVRYTESRNGELTYLTGELKVPEKGRFFFQKQTRQGVAGEYVGVVELPGTQRAFRIEPAVETKGQVLVERQIDQVMCVNLPAVATSSSNRVEYGPPLKPADYPDLPIPGYQHGVPVLEGQHGAPAVIYLDFQGGYTTTWGGVNYGRPDFTKDEIREIWMRVVEDYMPFNVNVTTDVRVYERAAEGSRQRCIFTPTPVGGASTSGMAYGGSFNWTGDTPCWVFLPGAKPAAEVASHEVGHTLGLDHEGQITASGWLEYYGGQGSGELGWAPIMGISYSPNISQWCRGEYLDANNNQDELAIIVGSNNMVAYRADDTGDTLATSRYLEVYTNDSAFAEGVIERSGDTDAFQFTTSGGALSLRAEPVALGPNLALQVSLYDAEDALIVQVNPQDTLAASLETDLPGGTYTFRVTGSGRGSPLIDGFSAYGSLGYYSITGRVQHARLPDRFTVKEHAPNGTYVGLISAGETNAGHFEFTKVAGDTNGIFALDNVGNLTVADNRLLDYQNLGRNSQFPVALELFVNIINELEPALTELNRRVVIAVIQTPGPPVIVEQPHSAIVAAGTDLVLSTTVTGTEPLDYQWFFNGQVLTNQFDSQLQLTNLQSHDIGEYFVAVSNSVGAVTSAVALLEVRSSLPSLYLQPRAQATFPGFGAEFTVAARGTEPITYQWQLKGTDIYGATQNTLWVTNTDYGGVEKYRCDVSNEVGSVDSCEAELISVPIAAWGWNDAGQTDYSLQLSNAVDTAAGGSHSLTLRIDGSVFDWGAKNGASLPSGVSNATAIAAGGQHDLALRSDGTVVAWGDNSEGQTIVPQGLSNVIAIAAGDKHSLALKADGRVEAWGLASSGQTAIPLWLTNIVAIAAGSNHSLALRGDGKVFAWGDNSAGQVDVPTNLANVVAIAAGAYHSVALKLDGRVVAWGANDFGQVTVPSGLSNVIDIAAGSYHTLVLRIDGSLSGWGAGNEVGAYPQSGQLIVPATVSNVTAVSAGGAHTLALVGQGPPFITHVPVGRSGFIGRRTIFRTAATGALPLYYQWQLNGADIPGATNLLLVLESPLADAAGNYRVVVTNAFGKMISGEALLTLQESPPSVVSGPVSQTAYMGGQVDLEVVMAGSGPFAYQWRFNGVEIPGATNALLRLEHLSLEQSGYYFVEVSSPLGVFTSGKAKLTVAQVVAWGSGPAFAYFDYGQSRVPVDLSGVVQLAGGGYHSLALKTDGTVWGWGGLSSGAPRPYNYGQAIPPSGLRDVISIAAGDYHSVALKRDGTVVAWGAGTTNSGFSPHFGQALVPSGLNNVVSIAAGELHSVAVRSDGSVVVWGGTPYTGVTNIPPTATNIVSVASAGSLIVALRADGSVVTWGSNTSIRTGLDAVAVACGNFHWLSLRSDGALAYWGSSPPAGLGSLTQIAAGYNHSLALKSSGALVTWGTSDPELSRVPAGLSNVIDIAAGRYHSLAALGDGSLIIKMPPMDRIAALGSQAAFIVDTAGAQPILYQWQLNGRDLPASTNNCLRLKNVHLADAGDYRVIIRNPQSTVTSQVARLEVLLPVAQALDGPGLNWLVSGSPEWSGQTNITHDGVAAARTGAIGDAQQSSIETRVAGPGTLNFWWKVSSEEYFDWLSFYIDGAKRDAISGEVDWTRKSFPVPAGSHTLKWVYAKDSSVSAGEDAGWLDQVEFRFDPPVILQQPGNAILAGGAVLRLSVTAAGAPPLTYQWLKDGTNLTEARLPYFEIDSIARRDSGRYSVQVSNPGGTVASSNAVVRVRVPQRLGAPVMLAGHTFMFFSRDLDGDPVVPGMLEFFEAQTSTDLVNWITLTNSLISTNGDLLLVDPAPGNAPARFYRLVEH